MFGTWRVAPGTWVIEMPIHENGAPAGEMFYDINCGAPPFVGQPTYRQIKWYSFGCGLHHWVYDDSGYWPKHEALWESYRYGLRKGKAEG